jgi:hypothetical protein
MIKTKVILGALVLSFLLFATPALAKGQPFPSPRRALNEERVRACEANQEAIKNRMGSLTRLTANMVEKFDSISTRVQTFYTDKVVPSGENLSNYDALVAEIAAKKAIVDTDLGTAQTSVDAFSCDTDNPKEQLNTYRLNMQKVKTDLKNYRTSIKNLIVAVRSLAPEPSPSPTP